MLKPAIIKDVEKSLAAPSTGHLVLLGSAPMPENNRRALRGMHNWTALGQGSLPEELLEIDGLTACTVLGRFHALLVKVWNEGNVPQERKDSGSATIQSYVLLGDASTRSFCK